MEQCYNEIEEKGGDDKKELKKVIDELSQQMDKGQIEEGAIKKHFDLIAKHAWITQPIAQMILKFLGAPL